MSDEQRARALIECVEPLLELFATLDVVFTEEGALIEHKQISLGRVYRAWKDCRAELDPEWKDHDEQRSPLGQPVLRGPEKSARRAGRRAARDGQFS